MCVLRVYCMCTLAHVCNLYFGVVCVFIDCVVALCVYECGLKNELLVIQ